MVTRYDQGSSILNNDVVSSNAFVTLNPDLRVYGSCRHVCKVIWLDRESRVAGDSEKHLSLLCMSSWKSVVFPQE